MNVPDESRRTGRRAWIAAGLLAAVILAATLLWGRPIYDLLADQGRIRAWVQGFGPWAPLAVVLLETAQVLLAPLPGHALGLAAGYLFGVGAGTLYTMAGIVAGSAILFALTRRFGRPLAARLIRPDHLSRLDGLVQQAGALFFFLVWLVPFVPDDLACLAAGLTPIPARMFLAIMILGRLPGIWLSAWIGAHAASIGPGWWGATLVGLALVAVAAWRWGRPLQAVTLRQVERLASRFGRKWH